jgi:hypothetical protein
MPPPGSTLTLLLPLLLTIPYAHVWAQPIPLASDSSLKLPFADFVHVTYVDAKNPARLQLLEAHRSWRQGIQAVIGVNVNGTRLAELNTKGKAHNDVYIYYQDRAGPKAGVSYLSGDMRAALMPFIAHKYLSSAGYSYKW